MTKLTLKDPHDGKLDPKQLLQCVKCLLVEFELWMSNVENVKLRANVLTPVHSGHFYSALSSPLLLRGAPDYSTDTISEFHAEAHRQLQVKDLPKVPT